MEGVVVLARQQRIVERAGEVKDSFERRHRLRDFTERLLDVLATRQVGANEPRVERAQDFLVRGGRLAAPQQHDFPGAVVGEQDASRRPARRARPSRDTLRHRGTGSAGG